MMDKIVKFVIFYATIIFCVSLSFAAECPSYTKVQTCTPKCWEDSECSAIGGKCCPNVCNGRSCAQRNTLSGSDTKYSPFSSKTFGGSVVSSGTNCGNVKCSVFEKCIMDPHTKRMKCVRT